MREGAEVDALWSVPLDRPATPFRGPVIVFLLVHRSGEAEIGYLGLELGCEQYVSGCEVAVDEVLRLEVHATTCDLSSLKLKGRLILRQVLPGRV